MIKLLLASEHPRFLKRRLCSISWTLFVCVLLAGSACAADSTWKLVWGDDFDRDLLGPDWYVRVPNAEIVNGQLHLRGHGVTVLTERGFAHDVRLEYDARQDLDVPPIDLSSTTGASRIFGWGHLHSLGLNNRVDGLDQVYHMVVEKEGRRIRFWVDDRLVHESKPDEILGGPGMDRVGFVTWGGMYVDHFKVYERSFPHEDSPKFPRQLPPAALSREGRSLKILGSVTPTVEQGVAEFNQGNLSRALDRFRSETNFDALLGQAYILGDLDYTEPFHHPEFAALAEQFEEAARIDASDAVSDYALLAREFSHLNMRRSRPATTAVLRLTGLGEGNNPFYHKAWLYLARYHYWNGMEGGKPKMLGEAREWMANLRKLWPEQTILRQYTGESVPWAELLNADTNRHPAWAAYLREAYVRNLAIMETFFRERQTPDGQLHGGWGDDVELLRTWVQIAAISSAAEPVRQGIERLCEGVWQHVLKNGYGGLSDVEHSSEDSADTVPTMQFLRYGDPLWVERNLQSCRQIKEHYMGVDQRGYPRFKSSYFGGDMVDTNLASGGDVGYCARPMKHFLWAAWQGNPEAKAWFVRWADGWRAATMSEEAGKLPGVAPFAIWYPSGSISPPAPDHAWHDDLLHRWRHAPMMHDVLLAGYWLTGDRKFLEPWRKAMEWATRGPLIHEEGLPGSIPWQIAQTSHLPGHNPAEQNRAALYRWLSGDSVYDEYILRAGGGAVFAYRLHGDLDAYLKSFAKAARSLRSNLELQTTEVLSTDRAALGHAIDIFGAYTGAITGLRDAATPTFSVTYDSPSPQFAALVLAATKERVRLWLYQFEAEPMSIGLKLWRLQPGDYELLQGEQLPGERDYQHRYAWQPAQQITLLRKAEGPTVIVPPGKVWVVDLHLVKPMNMPEQAPDLAIAARDVVPGERGLRVTLHNLGNGPSEATHVVLQTLTTQGWQEVARVEAPPIEPSKNLEPAIAQVRLPSPKSAAFRVVIDSENRQFEWNEANNAAEVFGQSANSLR